MQDGHVSHRLVLKRWIAISNMARRSAEDFRSPSPKETQVIDRNSNGEESTGQGQEKHGIISKSHAGLTFVVG